MSPARKSSSQAAMDERPLFAEINQMEKMSDTVVVNSAHEFADAKVAFSPDRRTLRTVLRDMFRSRAISLIDLPLTKCSRRIRPIVSSASPTAHFKPKQATHRSKFRGSILDADPPAQGVKIARRNTE